jgi:hypothetical protein
MIAAPALALALAAALTALPLACGGSSRANGPGAACAQDADCQTGTCVQQVCGVQDCSQIGAGASLEKLEVTDMLSSSAPSANPVGGAILLMGNFATASRICLDDQELTPHFNDGVNAMLTVPSGASIGKHAARVITTDGRVSPAITINVTQAYSGSRVFTDATGAVHPILTTPTGVFTPAPKVQVDPITNEWRDAGGVIWSMTGSPWPPSVGPSGVYNSDRSTKYGTITGAYDIPNKRIDLTVTENCATPPCKVWDYVGIFSCWQPGNSICSGFDPCKDSYDPNDPASVSAWTTTPYRRDLVLFPVGDADPQGVLRVGTCQ